MTRTYTYFYGVVYEKGREIKRIFLDSAIESENGTISARKYNSLKDMALHTYIKKNQHISIETADGRRDTFGGYPAYADVRFK